MPTDENAASSDPMGKKRRGAFPRMPLKAVVELVNGMYELGHGDPVRRRTAFEHINRSPDSSTSYTLNAAATSGYELIRGGKNAQYLTLAPLGERFAKAKSHSDRVEAAYDILFANHFFAAIVEKYAERPMPSDPIATDYLQREHGLSAADAAACWAVAKQNISDFGLFEESNGKRVVLAREHAAANQRTTGRQSAGFSSDGGDQDLEQHSGEESAPVALGNVPQHQPAPVVSASRGSGLITPQIAFNIQVVLPENASAETYDAIFQSMAIHLLGRDNG